MPNTIAQNLARLTAARTAIANAITAQGGTVNTGDGFEEFPTDIATIGVSKPHKDVNFYDYDGTVVHSYTAEEFAELTELPDNPTHTGLTAQGWNWTLANAKLYVSKYGKLNIGQMYITSDGKTRLYIHLTKGRTTPNFQLYLNANSELDIDWGDGTAHSTFTTTSADFVNETHAYPATDGDYVITVTVVSGSFELKSSSTNISSILWNRNGNAYSLDRAYTNSIQKIEIGSGITSIGSSAFRACFSLTNIVIPNGVTSIGSSAFRACYSLANIVIPNGVTSIGTDAFYDCFSLANIVIPNGVTSIGTDTFRGCYSLANIVIPNGVTSIETDAFYNCCSLTNIVIPNGVTSIGSSAFRACYSLANIVIPNGVTSIGTDAFYNCHSLTNIVIPNGVTSIGSSAFRACYSLANIVIPNGVTSIGTDAFYNCAYMDYIQFKSTTPPTVSSSDAFSGVSATTLIIVPVNCLQAYTTATNYPNSAAYTYLIFGTYNSGETLPTTSTDGYNLTWYATMENAKNQTNPITQGNGSEVYARGVSV